VQSAVKAAQGGMSTESQQWQSLKVRVDGPYGVGHVQWGFNPVTVLVAGGIGITPGIGIASYIIGQARRADVDIVDDDAWHVHLVWVIKDRTHTERFADQLKLQ
jgi:predicted ferric reductase